MPLLHSAHFCAVRDRLPDKYWPHPVAPPILELVDLLAYFFGTVRGADKVNERRQSRVLMVKKVHWVQTLFGGQVREAVLLVTE